MPDVEREQLERAIVVGMIRPDQSRELVNEYLDELELLADTAGAEVLERIVQERSRIDPAYMIGRGKAQELAAAAKYLDIDLIIFDDDLTPAQVRNLESLCKTKIVDRSGLILDIFAKHARTREARTQVELAQLKYLLPRLTRQWQHLSRQIGGIGVRGPGETQLETDRRLIRTRIKFLQKELEKIAEQRTIRRKARRELFKAALIGYTNVGKSTLLNALTNAQVPTEDRLFATLDATIRAADLFEHRRVLFIDTVGFIRKLPPHLVASFKSTLEETADADLLLHVIDVSHPFFRDQMAAVEQVLVELNLNNRPILNVFNKIDKLEDQSLLRELSQTHQPCVFISAERGFFLGELIGKISEFIERQTRSLTVILPHRAGQAAARLHQLAEVEKIDYQENEIVVSLRATVENAERIARLAADNEGRVQ
ncbi:MAG: GTPase HflX [candidate division KSB1 bacterium]|nr:GTPase HflX [candidate division KSB1 bacterium]MDZ7346163.1 GTPase HflX [candidate division KSB1 bacterium]